MCFWQRLCSTVRKMCCFALQFENYINCRPISRFVHSTRETSGLSLDDNQEIRGALLGLIHFYVDKEITYDELNSLSNFILAIQEEYVVS